MKAENSFTTRFLKIARFIGIGLGVGIGSFIFLFPQLFSCATVRFSDFTAVSDKLYISPTIKSYHLKRIQRMILRSEKRVGAFYSGKISQPVIIVCSNPEEYRKYCSSSEGAGCSLGTPWGSSYIVLNAQEMNVDVASHEMSHIELLSRLGWWKTTTQIPQWFNEGLALMLDKRFVSNPDPAGRYLDYMDEWLIYTGGGQEILELEHITSVKDFFSGSEQQVMLSYMTSGLEVSYWFLQTGEHGVLRLIEKMKDGEDFQDAYRHTETDKQHISIMPGVPVNPLRRTLPDQK